MITPIRKQVSSVLRKVAELAGCSADEGAAQACAGASSAGTATLRRLLVGIDMPRTVFILLDGFLCPIFRGQQFVVVSRPSVLGR